MRLWPRHPQWTAADPDPGRTTGSAAGLLTPQQPGEPVSLPDVPEGTLLTLRPGEWGPRQGILDTERQVDVRTVRIYRARTAPGYVVIGHGVECTWPSVEPHPPCMELYVTESGIVRAGRRRIADLEAVDR